MNALALTTNQCIPASAHKVYDLSCDKPAQIKKAFVEQGYVVVQNVSSRQDRDQVAKLVQRNVQGSIKVGCMSELYYDDVLPRARRNPNMQRLFSTLLDDNTLWVAFDRCLNAHPDKNDDQPISLHVDQNPHTSLGLASVHGLLALPGSNSDRAVLGVVPGSHRNFVDNQHWYGAEQRWLTLPLEASEASRGKIRAVRLAEGELVVWDARLTHSRFMGKDPAKAGTLLPMIVVPPQQRVPDKQS